MPSFVNLKSLITTFNICFSITQYQFRLLYLPTQIIVYRKPSFKFEFQNFLMYIYKYSFIYRLIRNKSDARIYILDYICGTFSSKIGSGKADAATCNLQLENKKTFNLS